MTKVSVLVSLYRCANFLDSFFRHALTTENIGQVEFILLHNDPVEEETLVIDRYLHSFPDIVYVIIEERESLYRTWNRGILMAKGQYITVWNVDDIRFPDSIAKQANKLDENPDAAIAYGDIYGSVKYGEFGERFYRYPEWKDDQKIFLRSYVMSCFQMWRKTIHESLGYYDEQFRCVGDFDFQIRAAMHFPFVKVSSPLGVYLEDAPHKLSSSVNQVIENNMIYLRYGVLEKLQLHLLGKSVDAYKKNLFLFFGSWVRNPEKTPFSLAHRFVGAIKSLSLLPFQLARISIKKLSAHG
jgi:glycosyltransferase involved in cell wall biosynthesis